MTSWPLIASIFRFSSIGRDTVLSAHLRVICAIRDVIFLLVLGVSDRMRALIGMIVLVDLILDIHLFSCLAISLDKS